MKRLVTLALALLMLLTVAACGKTDDEQTNPGADMTIDEIMATILEGVNSEIAVMSTPLDEENFAAYAFIDPIEDAEGVATESAITAVAHSVVLLRLPEESDAQEVAKQIEENADPRKWICVEAEKTEVVSHGNLVLLVMSFEEDATTIVNNFNTFCEQ